MSKFYFILFYLLINLQTSVSASALDKKVVEFQKIENILIGSSLSSKEISTQLTDHYFRLFSQDFKQNKQIKIADKNIELYFNAASTTAFYTNNPEIVRELANLFTQLVIRKKVKKQHFLTLYGSFLAARMFKEANDFLLQYPSRSIEPLPEFRENEDLPIGKSTIWSLESDQRVLTRNAVDISIGGHLVVISHPQCHFSQNLFSSLIQDKTLFALFQDRTIWLTPQDRNFSFNEIQEWNKSHPEFKYHITHQRDEWPAIDYWGTPSFYFFKDGVIVSKVIGWPKEGRKQEILAAFKLIGIE